MLNIGTTKVRRPISGLSGPGGIEIKAYLMAGKDDFAKSWHVPYFMISLDEKNLGNFFVCLH